MRISRKLQLWLADKHPAFDRPQLYRRPLAIEKPAGSVWDAILIAMIALVLLGFGLAALLAGLFFGSVLVSSWF